MIKKYFVTVCAVCVVMICSACSSGAGSVSTLERAYMDENLELIKEEAPKLYEDKSHLNAEELATLALSYLYISDHIAIENLQAGHVGLGEGKDYTRKAVELYELALQKDAEATNNKLEELNPMGKDGLALAQSMVTCCRLRYCIISKEPR